jgi:hypothetical protein
VLVDVGFERFALLIGHRVDQSTTGDAPVPPFGPLALSRRRCAEPSVPPERVLSRAALSISAAPTILAQCTCHPLTPVQSPRDGKSSAAMDSANHGAEAKVHPAVTGNQPMIGAQKAHRSSKSKSRLGTGQSCWLAHPAEATTDPAICTLRVGRSAPEVRVPDLLGQSGATDRQPTSPRRRRGAALRAQSCRRGGLETAVTG